MRTYTVEVFPVPVELVVEANNEEEAKEKAKEIYYNSPLGMASVGVYESNIIDVI